MRIFNCKRATRMMPLYVGGELPGDLDREMGKHLAICEACGRLAQEFCESNSLLTEACATPEFDAQFYDEIRNTVLDKIARDGLSSKPQFGRSWIYAGAFALMFVVSAFMFVRWQVAREAPRDSASIMPATDNTASNQGPNSAMPLQSKELRSKSRRASVTQKPMRRETLSRPDPKQFELARKSDASAGVPRVSPPERASASEVSRIEIQTSNPNIRIIWLVAENNRGTQETNQYPSEPETKNKDRE